MSKLPLMRPEYEMKAEGAVKIGNRDGTPIEKGVILNEEYLEKYEDSLQKVFAYYAAYPDRFLDAIAPAENAMHLFFYQRIMLRVMMRFKSVHMTACRATSKTFITILAMILQCVLIPGHQDFIAAPNKNQAASIAKQKITEILTRWPFLRKEIVGNEYCDENEVPGNYGKDYVCLKFRNGAMFEVCGAAESSRGLRKHSGLVDELLLHDETTINEVVKPLLNVSRRLPDGSVNDKEPNQQLIFMSSASQKGDFNYITAIDTLETAIMFPRRSFCMGIDYRLPMREGLITKEYVYDLKMAPNFQEESFAREYASIYTGGGEDSWYSYDKLQKYRKIKNPEFKAKNCKEDNRIFYILGVDISRYGSDQSVCCVIRVNPTQDKFFMTLVNVVVLGKTPEQRTFDRQAVEIKKLIQLYDAKNCIIDLNGIGAGIGDMMIQEQTSEGVTYPAYGFANDENYLKIQPRSAKKILIGMKANATLKSQINANAYAMLTGGRVRFLIKEQEAKVALMNTKVGQKMSALERIDRLMPHELTTRLFEEMANMRIKRAGTDIILEPINSHIHDDKYYSFVYALWHIKGLEEDYYKKQRRSLGGTRQLVFFTGG